MIPLLTVGLVSCAIAMVAVWLLAVRIDNYGIVDVAWAAAFTPLALLYGWLSGAPPARTALVLILAIVWSLRLAGYLAVRIARHHPTEDTRYQDLRRAWRSETRRRMFWFFQAQAVAAVFLSLPFALALLNPAPRLEPLELMGAALGALGLIGEATADWQLDSFKRRVEHRGRLCTVGLWRYSRHPNYFFEWMIWCGFAVVACAAPWGWLALSSPIVMLWLLLRVTGIPATERAAVARRGDAYREYQRTTSAFVPWFPRS